MADKQLYKPSEIAELGLITNSKGKPDYRYVLRLVTNGNLKAIDYSLTGQKAYWLVHIDEIKRFNKERGL